MNGSDGLSWTLGRARRLALLSAGLGALAVVCHAAESFSVGPLPDAVRVGLEAVALITTLGLAATLSALLCQTAMALDAADEQRLMLEKARTDGLSGCYTRAHFLAVMRTVLRQRSGRAAAYLQLDMDRLKVINDTLGHGAGDEAIQHLVSVVRRELPGAVIGRIGGDEFGVLVSEAGTRDAVTALAERILETLAVPVTIGGRPTRVSATIGVAFVEDDAPLAEELISLADLALYRGKDRRGCVVAYDEQMLVDDRHARFLARELRAAIYLDELDVHYQPIFVAGKDRPVAYEALVRWNHPLRGTISPAAFVPVAEQSTLIDDLGRWVLARVCRDLPSLDAIRVSVNVSAVQLRSPDFARRVLDLLAHHGTDPSRIAFEVTESVLLDGEASAQAAFETLRRAGARICLDDFGAGFAGLGYLRRLRFDVIKLDRTLVAGAASGGPDQAFVAALLAMARAIDTDVLAEGIETEEQLALMRAAGCRFFQGYLLGRPAPLSHWAPLTIVADDVAAA
ncbi:putative bifunctional diguanylate cyclase/phosphodiesterase [Oharaeibacter diazotrophicus]|uniref:Diguanylate cyclase/phosphodiesterase n=1 Tax=Oharaeibacter diazotrophicus TaxID=1920512 RepID=A0A4R6RLS1_9HYPH|nr:bifunctional diguanylate cyclase/phosphodiesterase [Oharaeibacter diazotrophicus]TDP86917.1 diguanylate cyclase/phosphodiesterase [Oharaeibacter diazotrophicus]BBE71140.1 phytochrome-like protein cph2 [Pleomorphomonas sp. SM30]GLS77894.1 hypothetical protein GCM10007904_32310 [Oharaeibacter diazotrophicus]